MATEVTLGDVCDFLEGLSDSAGESPRPSPKRLHLDLDSSFDVAPTLHIEPAPPLPTSTDQLWTLGSAAPATSQPLTVEPPPTQPSGGHTAVAAWQHALTPASRVNSVAEDLGITASDDPGATSARPTSAASSSSSHGQLPSTNSAAIAALLPSILQPPLGPASSSKGAKKTTHDCSWPHCGKAFSSKWGLERHFRIHTGEKPYVCQLDGCGKGFVDRALLARHERTHSKERNFHCPYPGCAKAFKVQKHLEYHTQLHLQPDVFCCGVDGCTKNFSNPSSLRIHRLLDHEDESAESATERALRKETEQANAELAELKDVLGRWQRTGALASVVDAGHKRKRDLEVQQSQLERLRHERELLVSLLAQAQAGAGVVSSFEAVVRLPAVAETDTVEEDAFLAAL